MQAQLVGFITNKTGDVYAEGTEAYHDGAAYESCPHPADSQDRHDWEEGYLDSEAEGVASPA